MKVERVMQYFCRETVLAMVQLCLGWHTCILSIVYIQLEVVVDVVQAHYHIYLIL